MTVKEFIEQNPDATLDMMTPVGFLQLTPEQAAELLQGECVNAHPGDRESWAKVTMEELLPQEILHCKPHPHIHNYYYMFTAQEQEHGKEISQFAGTMQAKCWRGRHPFDWNDIAFEQEIIESDAECWFCRTPEDMLRYMEYTVLCEGKPYIATGGHIQRYPKFNPEEYVLLKLIPSKWEDKWYQWNQELPPNASQTSKDQAEEFSRLKVGYRGDLRFSKIEVMDLTQLLGTLEQAQKMDAQTQCL